MDSKVLGIPLAVWFFLIGLGLILGLPLFISHEQEMRAIQKVDFDVLNSRLQGVMPSPMASPSATPTVTVVPSVKSFVPFRPSPTSVR